VVPDQRRGQAITDQRVIFEPLAQRHFSVLGGSEPFTPANNGVVGRGVPRHLRSGIAMHKNCLFTSNR
jgi:hypothetical protein